MEFYLRIEGHEDDVDESPNDGVFIERFDNVLFDTATGEWKILFYDLRHLLEFSRQRGRVSIQPSDEPDQLDTIVLGFDSVK